MSTKEARVRGKHDLGCPRGDPRDLHAGGLRVPRGRPDPDEERRPHRSEERPHPRDRVDRLLPRRLRDRVRRRRQRVGRRLGVRPDRRRAPRHRSRAVLVVRGDPGRPATCSRRRSRRCRSRSSGARWPSARALGVLRLRRRLHADLLRRLPLDLEPDGWLFAKGMQDFAGSTVVHYQGALAGLAGALLLGPRIGKFVDGKPQPIPGHNMAYTTLGVFILWFGWFGFNPGSTLTVDFGGVGFFAYVALNTNLAAAAGVIGAGHVTAWIVIQKPDLSMMLNGAIGALVAITAACAFVAPWAAIVIGFVAGAIVVLGVAPRRAGRDRRPGRRPGRARDGRRLGDAVARVPDGAQARRDPRDWGGRAPLRRRAPPARRPGARPRRGRRVHVHRVVPRPLG